ncbi:MAG: family 20 glycosylhydrolase [Bacteroidales bacterium]|nr:family 20 glycosylhydrolase [Bacteroidales bacterium]
MDYLKPFIIATLLTASAVSINAQSISDLVPVPQNVIEQEGVFTIDKHTIIIPDSDESFSASYLQQHISPIFEYGIALVKASVRPIDNAIVLRRTEGFKPESYSLTICDKGVTIKSSDDAGLFYGVQTLLQMFPQEVYSGEKLRLREYPLQKVIIEDSPRFPHRGFMLDVSRTFFDKEYIKQFLDWMSAHKLNVFQWHLTDDNGWRIEIKKYPQLTEKGAWRGRNEVIPATYLSGNERYGGYYTQKEIKEIVAYAAQRNITIIPEIDLPGHALSSTVVLDGVTCGTTTDKASACGEFDNVWCVSKESNYKILDNIFKEIAALFPGPYISIAADEVVWDYWAQCPSCRALMEKEGYKEVPELLGHFVRRMEKIINKHGKRLAGFDDIQDAGGVGTDALVVAWRGYKKARESVGKGYPTVMQLSEYCYLDMQYSPAERGHNWAAIIPLDKIYNYEPTGGLGELTPEQEKLVLGPQGGLWTELLQYPPRFAEYQVFPRLAALAEVGWSNREARDYEDFHRRLVSSHYRRLDKMGIAFRVEPPVVKYNDQQIDVILPYPSAIVRYSTDGSDPIRTSRVVNGTIVTDSPEKFRFATFWGDNLQSIPVAPEGVVLNHWLKPDVRIETDIKMKSNTPLTNITGYNFRQIARSDKRLEAGQALTYIFDEPVQCTKIGIPTGYAHIPFYGVSDGYVEYSYDGKTFIKGPEFKRYYAEISGFEAPVKAVRIVITMPNDGSTCCFQNLRIE